MVKKKVLYVAEAMGGGVFTYLVNLSNELSEKYDIYIAYGIRRQTPKNLESYFHYNIQLIKVKNFSRAINPIVDFKALMELIKIGKKVKPDYIHLHSSKAGVLGRIAFMAVKCPIFYTPHGYSFLIKEERIWKRWIYFVIEWIMARLPGTIITCSEGEYLEARKLSKRVKLVNNGINRSEIDAFIQNGIGQQKSGRRRYRVFTLGRVCYQKNPVLFNEIALKMPDIDFIWIGNGNLESELNAPNITVTGWIKRREALKIAYTADCFLLPSRWEGLPISLLEAMYLRKPCVVSDVIGNHNVIHSGVNGYVCTTSDEFVTAIRNMERGIKTKEMIEAAYQDILSEYNIEQMAEKYSRIYEEKDGYKEGLY